MVPVCINTHLPIIAVVHVTRRLIGLTSGRLRRRPHVLWNGDCLPFRRARSRYNSCCNAGLGSPTNLQGMFDVIRTKRFKLAVSEPPLGGDLLGWGTALRRRR